MMSYDVKLVLEPLQRQPLSHNKHETEQPQSQPENGEAPSMTRPKKNHIA